MVCFHWSGFPVLGRSLTLQLIKSFITNLTYINRFILRSILFLRLFSVLMSGLPINIQLVLYSIDPAIIRNQAVSTRNNLTLLVPPKFQHSEHMTLEGLIKRETLVRISRLNPSVLHHVAFYFFHRSRKFCVNRSSSRSSVFPVYVAVWSF